MRAAGRTTVLTTGGPIVRVAGARPALALTLLRATGMLSRLGMTLRPLPAGPMLAIEGPQMLGPVEVRYGLAVGESSRTGWPPSFWIPCSPPVRSVGATGRRKARPSAVRGAEVSALRREGGRVEVRLFNPRDQVTTVEIVGRSGWLVDLRGRPLAPFEGSFELRPQGIVTVRLDGD